MKGWGRGVVVRGWFGAGVDRGLGSVRNGVVVRGVGLLARGVVTEGRGLGVEVGRGVETEGRGAGVADGRGADGAGRGEALGDGRGAGLLLLPEPLGRCAHTGAAKNRQKATSRNRLVRAMGTSAGVAWAAPASN